MASQNPSPRLERRDVWSNVQSKQWLLITADYLLLLPELGPKGWESVGATLPYHSPAHKLPTGSAVWLVVPHSPALCSQIMCLFTCQLCQLSIFSKQTASFGLSDSVTAFTPSTGVCIFPSFLLPKFLLRLASISSWGKNSGYISICALYKNWK